MTMKILLWIIFFAAYSAFAGRILPESAYQANFAKTIPNAQTEVVAPDGTRCDILTDEYAIEVDFADKWAEAIGQSLNYAIQFNKRAGIVLIIESQNDYKYVIRLNSIIAHFNLPIKLWNVDAAQQLPASAPNRNIPASAANQISNKESLSYWISKTGKRHNHSCRYYKNCRGRIGSKSDGIACKICGG